MIKTINGWTKDKVLKRIKKYMHGVCMVGDNCMYENKKGNRCAVGIFLDHRIHKKEVFKYDGDILALNSIYNIEHTLPFSLQILIKIQKIHDAYRSNAYISQVKKYNNENYKTPEAALTAWVNDNVVEDS